MSNPCAKRGGQLFARRRNTMAADDENKVKIRFKFRSGEEFEAEGSPSFIEKQRADFLDLIGKEPKQTPSARGGQPAPLTRVPTAYRRAQTAPGQSAQNAMEFPEGYLDKAAQEDAYPAHGPLAPTLTPPGLSAAESHALHAGQHTQEQNARLWEQIARIEEGQVFLRRKSRLLTPETAALLLIAAAKILLRAENGYSALALSKSLAKSGYGGGRLDRALAGEIRQGAVRAVGSKRSRAYLLSDGGFARAYVLAAKLADEWR